MHLIQTHSARFCGLCEDTLRVIANSLFHPVSQRGGRAAANKKARRVSGGRGIMRAFAMHAAGARMIF